MIKKKNGITFQRHLEYFSGVTSKTMLSGDIISSLLSPKKTKIY